VVAVVVLVITITPLAVVAVVPVDMQLTCLEIHMLHMEALLRFHQTPPTLFQLV
jgi:hypothetical protein|tara:strand:- start:230 stop:391 length:162 start_codon:yes stop_codon:yes gene_type:complete